MVIRVLLLKIFNLIDDVEVGKKGRYITYIS